MMNAFSEGLVLAGRSGLDPSVLLDVLVSSYLDFILLVVDLLTVDEFILAGSRWNCKSNV